MVTLSTAKRSRRIPWRYHKVAATGFLDFARNDGSFREGPDAFGTIAAAERSEDTALVPSTLADSASSPRRPKPNPR